MDGIPITVRGGRYFIYRPPPGQLRAVRSASDGHNTPDSDWRSGRGLFPAPPRRVVLPRRSLAGLRRAPEHAVHEPVWVRFGREIAIASLQIGCALFDLPSAGPPERISALVSCHGELEPEMHRRRCKSLCFQWSEQTEKKKTDHS